MATQKTIPYLQGHLIKPIGIQESGEVVFTDGRNEVRANQQQCEAYGYTYDQETGTCSGFTFSTNLGRNINHENNNTQGVRNTVETGTNNTYIMGENNTVKGFSRNNIIIGNQNEIVNGINNTNVYGTLAQATADNSIVLGGNAGTDTLGERQSITVMFGRQTTNGTNTTSYMNNTTDSFFPVPDNTGIYFHAEVIAIRVGGSSGSGAVGDYASWVERGVVINKDGTVSINRERDAIKSSGTVTGWQPTGIVTSSTYFTLRVRGASNMTIEWAATVSMTQMKTGVVLS